MRLHNLYQAVIKQEAADETRKDTKETKHKETKQLNCSFCFVCLRGQFVRFSFCNLVLHQARRLTWARSAHLFLIAFLSSTLVLAQTAPAPKSQTKSSEKPSVGAVLLGRAPVSKDALRVKLPRGQEFTLPNGLRVILLERHELPTFTARMVILTGGGLSDSPEKRGRSQMTASLLREGTERRASKEISEQLETLGATLNADANLQTTWSSIAASGLVENLDQTLDVFADLIRHPKFPQDEVERFKTRAIASLKAQQSNPQIQGIERALRALYGDHPGGFFAAPVETISQLNSADLKRFHAQHYKPNNSVLLVMGDVTLNEVKAKIARVFGDWPRGDVPLLEIPAAPSPSATRIHLVHRPGATQTMLGFGTLGIQFGNEDYFSLLLMNHILGGPGAPRLYLNLREEKGYTYSVSSFFNLPKYRGYWFASAAVRTEVTDGAMQEFMYELKRIRDEKVTAKEMEDARRAIIGRFALDLERPTDLLENIVMQKIFHLPADYWDTYPQKVSAVTADDVQRAAQKYLDLSHLQIVAVGDAAKIRETLEKYGTVEVY